MLFEKCPTCKGARSVVTMPGPLSNTSTTVRACPGCKDGYVPHKCPRDASCPCYAVGRMLREN